VSCCGEAPPIDEFTAENIAILMIGYEYLNELQHKMDGHKRRHICKPTSWIPERSGCTGVEAFKFSGQNCLSNCHQSY